MPRVNNNQNKPQLDAYGRPVRNAPAPKQASGPAPNQPSDSLVQFSINAAQGNNTPSVNAGAPTTPLKRVGTGAFDDKGQEIFDVFAGDDYIKDPSDPRLKGVNIMELPKGSAPEGFKSKFQPYEAPKDRYTNALESMARQLENMNQTPNQGLSDDVKALYQKYTSTLEQAIPNIKERYKTELQDLVKKQEKARGQLAGRLAAAGFSEPGAITGEGTGEVPGIVTKQLQEQGELQERTKQGLTQAEQGDILSAQQAVSAAQLGLAEAEQNAQQQSLSNFYNRMNSMTGLLETRYNLSKPETFNIGGGLFERGPDGSLNDVTPEGAAWTQPSVDDDGNIYRVNTKTGSVERLGKVAKRSTGNDDGSTKEEKISSDVESILEEGRGKDDKVSSDKYVEAYQKWVKKGGALSDFLVLYPMSSWLTLEEQGVFMEKYPEIAAGLMGL